MKDLNSISGVKETMKANKGFTLLEVAVVLAIIAILAAILTPIVTSYIDTARLTRAQNDVKKIAESIGLFKRDTGVYPGYQNFGDATIGTVQQLGTDGNTGLSGCLVSGTTIGALVGSNSTVGGTWTCYNPGTLEAYVNVNRYSIGTVGIVSLGGRTAYRGPYLDGLAGTDPWGQPYAVNSKNFANAATGYAYAISGGPDGAYDTSQDPPKTSPFAPVDDDIVALIK